MSRIRVRYFGAQPFTDPGTDLKNQINVAEFMPEPRFNSKDTHNEHFSILTWAFFLFIQPSDPELSIHSKPL